MIAINRCIALGTLLLAVQTGVAADTGGAATTAGNEELSEVIVTGTRLQLSGFTTPTPVTMISSEEIANHAAGDLGAAIRDLPTVASSSGSVGAPRAGNNAGQNWIQLRGLPLAETLVLIDGRRTTGSSAQGPFDINMIPTGMVDRIDLVTGGASAAYGSDAVAGVANIVLKDKIEGIRGNVQVGGSEHGDAREVAGGLTLGHNFFNDRVNLSLGLDASSNGGIGPWYAREYGRQEPGLVSFPANRPAGTPSQGFFNGVEVTNATAGGLITTGPLANTAFNASGQPFTFTGSNYGNTTNSFYNINTPYHRQAALARVKIDVTENTRLTLEGHYGHTTDDNLQNALTTATTVSVNNPFLPAATRAAMIAAGQTTVTVRRTDVDLGPYVASQDDAYERHLAALSGKLFGKWSWDLSYQHSQSDLNGKFTGYRTADINSAFNAVAGANGQPACTLTAATTPGCVPFNIFGIGVASQAAFDYLRQFTQAFVTRMREDVIAGEIRGEPFSTWAAPVAVAVGGEYRQDKLTQGLKGDSVPLNGSFVVQNYATFDAKRHDREAFAEANFPLARNLPWLKALDLNAAVRATNYSDSGGVTTWKAGLTYEPSASVRLRATRSRDIRAATLFEQYGTGAVSFVPFVNPFNNNAMESPPFHKGANAALVPEIANTTTVGIVVQPEVVPSLRLSLDYYDVTVNGVLTPVFPQDLVNGCFVGVAAYCSQLTFSGRSVIDVTQRLLNLNKLQSNGFDFEAQYRLPMNLLAGQWSIRALASRTLHLKTTDPNGNVTDTVGTFQQPALKATVNLGYTHGAFSTTATVRWFSHIKYSSTLIGPDDPSYSPTLANSINKNLFPAAAYWNWSAQYNLPVHFLQQLQIYGLVSNVFDKQPPEFAAAAFAGGTAPRETYDMIGRTYRLGVRFSY